MESTISTQDTTQEEVQEAWDALQAVPSYVEQQATEFVAEATMIESQADTSK